MRPGLVIFDCDGVLVDSEPVSNQAMADNLARHGLHLTLAEAMQAFVGLTMSGVEAKVRAMGVDLPADWKAEVDADIHSALAHSVQVVPGIPALLAQLDAAGVPCCVASNGSRAKMRVTLGRVGLWARFDPVMFAAEDLGTGKPDPTIFLLAAGHFDLRPDCCLVIEDSASGAEAARRAGMRCLGYTPSGAGAALTAQGAQLVRAMSEVAALLEIS